MGITMKQEVRQDRLSGWPGLEEEKHILLRAQK
jgi:hypothetical protein